MYRTLLALVLIAPCSCGVRPQEPQTPQAPAIPAVPASPVVPAVPAPVVPPPAPATREEILPAGTTAVPVDAVVHAQVDSGELVQAFRNNQVQAEKKYLRKVIRVRGRITMVRVVDGFVIVYLDGGVWVGLGSDMRHQVEGDVVDSIVHATGICGAGGTVVVLGRARLSPVR